MSVTNRTLEAGRRKAGAGLLGTNRRYAAHYDRLMDDRIAETVAAKGGLQTLTPKELRLDVELLTIDPDPKRVLAWVRFYDTPLLVSAWACRWTSKAIGIRFEIAGREFKTWVWANAVESGSQ